MCMLLDFSIAEMMLHLDLSSHSSLFSWDFFSLSFYRKKPGWLDKSFLLEGFFYQQNRICSDCHNPWYLLICNLYVFPQLQFQKYNVWKDFWLGLISDCLLSCTLTGFLELGRGVQLPTPASGQCCVLRNQPLDWLAVAEQQPSGCNQQALGDPCANWGGAVGVC